LKKCFSRVICFALVLICGLLCLGAEIPIEKEQAEELSTKPVVRIVPPEKVIITAPPKEEETISEADALLIAKTLYGEYRGEDKLQQAAVAWCILNRCDYYEASVEAVVTAPNQFSGYSPNNPVDEELYATAVDVLRRHALEKSGEADVGRILPKDYMWFSGDGRINHFRNRFSNGQRWDWSLPDPYMQA